jgi:Receptor family ligand binding region
VNASQVLTLAFIFDNSSFKWGERIVDYTMQMLNAKDDGWHDDILTDGTVLNWTYRNDNCDEGDAAYAYWDIRTELGGVPPHGIVGARCSSASLAVALFSSVDKVTQVSPASTSPKLTASDLPNFLRLVAPDDASGQAGALKSLMENFGWKRLSILFTDTQYSRDLATSFKSLWPERGITSNSEIKLSTLPDGRSAVDEESVRQALSSVPVDNPAVNSRIILLVADANEAYEILRLAHAGGFQEDTIWRPAVVRYHQLSARLSRPSTQDESKS